MAIWTTKKKKKKNVAMVTCLEHVDLLIPVVLCNSDPQICFFFFFFNDSPRTDALTKLV